MSWTEALHSFVSAGPLSSLILLLPIRKRHCMMVLSFLFLVSTLIVVLLPEASSSYEVNYLHPNPSSKYARDLKLIDQDCLNGGVRVEGQCICPTFVTGPYCETIDFCSKALHGKYSLSNPFSKKELTGNMGSCDVLPEIVCCWQNSSISYTMQEDNEVERIKSLLHFYGPWTANDKLMLSYFFGDETRLGSTKFNFSAPKKVQRPPSLAFVIMVHSDFETRLPKLLENIYDSQNLYMIHVDRSVSFYAWTWATQFVSNFNKQHLVNNVYIVRDRFAGAWGSISLVYQEMASVIRLLELDNDGKYNWTHVINLSAFDFPIKPITKLERFLHSEPNIRLNFIETLKDSARRKVRQSELHLPCNRSMLVANYLDNEICASGSSNWMFRKDPKWVYGEGSQWHFLSRTFAEYLVSSMSSIELLFSMKYTLIPDEAYFQSAMLSSPFRSTLNMYNYRYLPWADQLQVQHKHVPLFKDTDAFFTRKVLNITVIDEMISELLRP